ncbi:MAG: peptidylprolyl isomerase [Deltaproteobacteria bacterium]|nr:peptidylprolyl isomerase [Deltaproteobacteria bacterium]
MSGITAKHLGAFFLFCLIFLAGACQKEQAPTSPTLIRINDKNVSLRHFQAEFKRSFPLWEKLPPEEKSEMQRALIAELIDRALVRSEADRLGISISDQMVEKSFQAFWNEYPPEKRETLLDDQGITAEQWKAEEKQRLLLKEVAMRAVYEKLQVSEEEVETYYRDNFADFKGEEEVRARQILLSSEENARQVLSLLRQGGSFAEVAREHSLSPDAAQGGDLGFFPRGQMPEEFDAVVFKLTPGRISDIVQTPYGFHIFLVEEHRKPTKPSLEETRPRIRSILLERKRETAYNNWLVRLRSRAFIEIDWSLLNHTHRGPQQAQN